MQTISSKALSQERNRGTALQIVDVRSPGEYQAGHIPGARHIPLDRIEAGLSDLDSSQQIILVCQSGKRATMAAERIEHSSIHLSVLEGGTAGWHAAGLPLVRFQSSGWSLERQVRLLAGFLALSGALVSLIWHPAIVVPIFIGAGLTFAGLTDKCGMAVVLAKLPWNRPVSHTDSSLPKTADAA